MNRKLFLLGISVFLMICAAESLIALRKALKEKAISLEKNG